MDTFSHQELADFDRDGFIQVKALVDRSLIERIVQITDESVAREIEPIEYESALGYPGAPASLDAPGGRTIRRLLKAIGRHPAFTELAVYPGVLARLRQLLGPEVVLPLAHHNCVMVKAPRYSSSTGWHRDIRYWRFQRPELITVLVALNKATEANGCVLFLPGSHDMALEPDQMDEAQFLRADLPRNRALIERAVPVVMDPGDVAFFHCRTFHAAGRNVEGEPRKSVLFTYRSADNPPVPGTRSAASPELLLHPPPDPV
jgi:phytanoyl-CoA hydroxylase